MKRIATAVLALACCLTPVRSVYAQADNGTEFGVQDDLTVLGADSLTTKDADVEIKGFTIFGSTEDNKTLGITMAPGNVWVNGEVQISSGLYVSSVTITGISTFTLGAGSIFIKDGTGGQVLKKDAATGALKWGEDNTSLSDITGTPSYVPVFKAGGGLSESVIMSTYSHVIVKGSMTIEGSEGVGLQVTGGTSTFDGSVEILPGKTFTVGTGKTSLGGDLDVGGNVSILTDKTLTVGTGKTTLGGDLDVSGAVTLSSDTYLGAAATRSTVTANGSIYLASGSSITLTGLGAKIVLPYAPALDNDATNKKYVDERVASGVNAGGPWTRDTATAVVRLTTSTDKVGIGIEVARAQLHVASGTLAALFTVSTGTVDSSQDVFGVLAGAGGVGEVGIKGNLALGQTFANSSSGAPVNGMAIEGGVFVGTNTYIEAATNTAQLQVKGTGNSGAYVATFYSGNQLAAWVRQK
jgi:hypothetical protein